MCQPLPVGDFVFEQIDSWLNNDGTPNVEKIMNLKVEDERGYFFEVDLEYLEELHDGKLD